MLDVRGPEDEELLEQLTLALLDVDREPLASGLVSLLVALDEEFGPPESATAAVVPFRRRAATVVLGVAAALVVFAVGLAMTGWSDRSDPSPVLNRLQYATASLQRDLGRSATQSRTAQDLVLLAHLLAQVPASQHAQVGPGPGRLIVEACQRLAGEGSDATLPDPCEAVLALPSTGHTAVSAVAPHGADSADGATDGSRSSGARTPTTVPWYVGGPDDASPGSAPTGGAADNGVTAPTAASGTGAGSSGGTDDPRQPTGSTTTTSGTASGTSTTVTTVQGGSTSTTWPGSDDGRETNDHALSPPTSGATAVTTTTTAQSR